MNSKEFIIRIIESCQEKMMETEKFISANAETGFREWTTSKFMEECFETLGYKIEKAGNIPGFIAEIDSGKPGPTLCIMAELDSLIVPDHPQANPKTGYAHACGHQIQCAAIIGVATALKKPEILADLCGKIRFAIVPAEELIEIEFREGLRKEGIIKYFSGKIEFLRRGLLDGVDLAFMVHTDPHCSQGFVINKGNDGCITKNLFYKGVASHAGSAPHLGINALYAAQLGMQAVNALRETFRERDFVRVHPIITTGGAAVNAIPSLVKIETFVRASSVTAMERENKRINRAFAAGAAALGAELLISDRFGYMPLKNDANMVLFATECMKEIVGEEYVFTESDVLRKGPGDHHLSVCRYKKDEIAVRKQIDGDWSLVRVGDTEGWCLSSILKKIDK